jgi:predicted nucleic acid-binding protein
LARTGGTRRAGSPRLILDSGAIIALSRRDSRARTELDHADRAGVHVSIPAVVLAETLRGSARDANVNRIVRSIGEVVAVDDPIARLAGALLGSTRSRATIDAIVVATAVMLGGAVILTSDPDDLGRLATNHPAVVVRSL